MDEAGLERAARNRAVKKELAAAAEHLVRADPRFGPVVAHAGACRITRSRDFSLFDSVAAAIISQQLTGKAATTIRARVPPLFGKTEFPTPEEVLAAPADHMRAAGLSGMKCAAIRDLAAKTLDGTLPAPRALHRMSDEDVIERLVAVRGVGRWTAEMLLIFDLGRLDVLPVADYGVRRGAGVLLGKRKPLTEKQLVRAAEPWRPYRSVASWYLWRVLEMPRA